MCRHSTIPLSGDVASAIIAVADEELNIARQKGTAEPEPEPECAAPATVRADMEAQKAAVQDAKRKSHEEWMRRHEPKQLSETDRKHSLRMLVLEAAQFHKNRRSAHLHSTVRSIVAGCRPDLLSNVPEKLTGLSPQLAQILFSDLDTLLTRKGGAVALSSLMELPLWQTRAKGCPVKPKFIDSAVKRTRTPAPPMAARPYRHPSRTL